MDKSDSSGAFGVGSCFWWLIWAKSEATWICLVTWICFGHSVSALARWPLKRRAKQKTVSLRAIRPEENNKNADQHTNWLPRMAKPRQHCCSWVCIIYYQILEHHLKRSAKRKTVSLTPQIIQHSGSKKSALLAKWGAQSAPETQFLAYCSPLFFAFLALK